MSGFGTTDHDLHKLRRAPLVKFFSKARILKLEPIIHSFAQRICDKILAQPANTPFDITMAYSCFTSDAISDYCLGESFGFLDQKSFEPNFRPAIYSFINTTYIFRFFPWVKVLATSAPLYVHLYLLVSSTTCERI